MGVRDKFPKDIIYCNTSKLLSCRLHLAIYTQYWITINLVYLLEVVVILLVVHVRRLLLSILTIKANWKQWIGRYITVIMGAMASQITSLTNVYSIVYSGSDKRKHLSPASLAFVWGVHRWPANSPYKWPVTRKIFPFDDVIMYKRIKCN